MYSSDAAFCATFTASVDTRTTGFPSKASAACGSAPARYSSACSCRPTISSTLTSSTTSTGSSTTSTTPTPTCTPYSNYNDGVRNGNFECDLAPWVAEDIPGTTHSVSFPGDASNFAFEFDQVGPVSSQTNSHPASLSQDLALVGNIPYNLRFRTYFDKCTQSEGFVRVRLNGQSIYTVNACNDGSSTFKDNLVQFYAPLSGGNIRFEFLIFETPATVKIDNVSAIPLH